MIETWFGYLLQQQYPKNASTSPDFPLHEWLTNTKRRGYESFDIIYGDVNPLLDHLPIYFGILGFAYLYLVSVLNALTSNGNRRPCYTSTPSFSFRIQFSASQMCICPLYIILILLLNSAWLWTKPLQSPSKWLKIWMKRRRYVKRRFWPKQPLYWDQAFHRLKLNDNRE